MLFPAFVGVLNGEILAVYLSLVNGYVSGTLFESAIVCLPRPRAALARIRELRWPWAKI